MVAVDALSGKGSILEHVLRLNASRYTAVALPWLILAATPLRRHTLHSFGAAALGIALGAISLIGYYRAH